MILSLRESLSNPSLTMDDARCFSEVLFQQIKSSGKNMLLLAWPKLTIVKDQIEQC